MVSSPLRSEFPRSNPRNGNIDALRLVAAIGVIALHVGPFPELSQTASDLIKGSFRWCVPFFFMLTGYYLIGGGGPNITIERLAVPLRAFVVASVIFLPVLLSNEGANGIRTETLLRGTYGHLWYLTALIIALLAVQTYQSDNERKLLFLVAGLIAVSYVAINYINAFSGNQYDALRALRELSGIPAVCIGGWLHGVRNLHKTSVLLLTGGIFLTVAEAVWLRSLGARPADVQLFAGTLPVAAGLLGIALSVRDVTPVWLAEFGRRESLGIYLYHPLAIFAAASLLSGDIRLNTFGVAGLPVWIIAAVMTALGLAVLRRLTPRLRKALDGAN